MLACQKLCVVRFETTKPKPQDTVVEAVGVAVGEFVVIGIRVGVGVVVKVGLVVTVPDGVEWWASTVDGAAPTGSRVSAVARTQMAPRTGRKRMDSPPWFSKARGCA
jgi:hypothetical protein